MAKDEFERRVHRWKSADLPDIATIATASPMTFLQQPTLMKVYVETPSKAPELI
jgi:hypothetical protein